MQVPIIKTTCLLMEAAWSWTGGIDAIRTDHIEAEVETKAARIPMTARVFACSRPAAHAPA